MNNLEKSICAFCIAAISLFVLICTIGFFFPAFIGNPDQSTLIYTVVIGVIADIFLISKMKEDSEEDIAL